MSTTSFARRLPWSWIISTFLHRPTFFLSLPDIALDADHEKQMVEEKKRLDLIVIPIEYVTRLGKATACLVSNKADFTAVRTLYTQSVPLKQGSPVYTEKPHFLLPPVLGSPVVYKLTISRLRITN